MTKQFTDSFIRKLNETCSYYYRFHLCQNHCDGIGWCKEVFEAVNNGTQKERHKQTIEMHGSSMP